MTPWTRVILQKELCEVECYYTLKQQRIDVIPRHNREIFVPLLVAFKCIPHAKYEKKPLLKCHFLCFFTTLYLIWPKFAPKRQHPLSFFVDFQWNMLWDSININNLCCNPVLLKNRNL